MRTDEKSVVLSGFAGTGKTTLAPLLAKELGLEWVDTDHMIEEETRLSVAELWEARGEAAFRALEHDVVKGLLDGAPRVVSFGGGTVTSRELRHLALDRAFLVTLTAKPETILARITRPDERPMLHGAERDPLGRIRTLLDARRGAYAEHHLQLATDEGTPEEVIARIVAERGVDRVVVPLGERTYPVYLVEGAPEHLRKVLAQLEPSRLLVVSDANVRQHRGEALERSLPSGVPVTHVTLVPGEEHKNLQAVQTIWNAGLESQVDRRSVVVGVGGGVVGDLAGFAASTLLRGLRVVQVPTTLLSMVDASVGGKTGFDVPEGKNLIGSFHQPSAVVVDLAHLVSLPRRDLRAGLAEVAKVALAMNAGLWENLEEHAEALAEGSRGPLLSVLRQAVALKADIVRDDEHEHGTRVLLNLGHTVGHALEAATGYTRYLHGEAVAIGLVAEARFAESLGDAAPGLESRVRALLVRLGLPVDATPDELAAAGPHLIADKKRTRSEVLLPVLFKVGGSSRRPVEVSVLAHALSEAAEG